jgi:hypothetical protein
MKKLLAFGLLIAVSLYAFAAGPTNFPNGITSYGVPVMGSGALTTTGKVFFVSSSNVLLGSNANPESRSDLPWKTLSYAITRATAGRGDVIVLMPSHKEDVTSPGALNINVSAVRIVGIGNGANRPEIRLGGVPTAAVSVNAQSVSMENIIFNVSVDTLNIGIEVNSPDFKVKNCEFKNHAAAIQAQKWIVLQSGADNASIVRNKVRQETAGPVAFVEFTSVGDPYIGFNDIVGDYVSGNVKGDMESTGTANDVLIEYNNMDNLNASDTNIVLNTETDGTIRYNTLRIATDGQITFIPTGNCQLFENYGVNADHETGSLIGIPSVF